jgi:hypothetical protein
MYALQESVGQMRGTAPAQIPGARISVCHGVGGMFAASGTIIMSNEARLSLARRAQPPALFAAAFWTLPVGPCTVVTARPTRRRRLINNHKGRTS